MKELLMYGAGAAALGVAGFLYTAAGQPKEFQLERSILTDASCETVYAIISDFERFKEWSPWQKLDPAMAMEMTGQQGHVGATYSWDGNGKVGAGKMTLIEAVPDSHVTINLEFLRPFPSVNTTVWKVAEEGGKRRITWSMAGSNDTLFQRAFALVVKVDKLVGKDFEAGLVTLRDIAERPLASLPS